MRQMEIEPLVTIHTFSAECVGPGIIGFGAPALRYISGIAWPTADLALYIPFQVFKSITVLRLWTFNSNPVGGNTDIGIYDETGVRIISSGSVAQAGVSSLQYFDITDTRIGPGRFYFGVAKDDTVGEFGVAAPSVEPGIAGVAQEANAFPLPATATFAAPVNLYVPVIGLTTRTV